MIERTTLYQSTAARRFFKKDRTQNPSMAAQSMLRRFGVGTVKRTTLHVASKARKHFKSKRRGSRLVTANPAPAALVAGAKALLSKFGFRSSDPKKDAERMAKIDVAFAARDIGMIRYWSTSGASAPQRQYALMKLAELEPILREEAAGRAAEEAETAAERRAAAAAERRASREAQTAERSALFGAVGDIGTGLAHAALSRGRSPRRRPARRRRTRRY